MTLKIFSLFMVVFSADYLLAQTQFPWPIDDVNQPHEVSGAFAEYRDTGSSDHFHSGTDIPKADGSPVYSVKDGVVTRFVTTGSAAYVRVQDMAYVHIKPNPALAIGDSVFASKTIVGTILPGQGHVHFINGNPGAEKNSSLIGSGLTPFVDDCPPRIQYIRFYQNNSNVQFPSNEVSGLVDIIVKVKEEHGPPGSGICRRNNGAYKVGYKILSADRQTVVFEPPNNGVRFQFDRKPNNAYVNIVFFKALSTLSSHVYQVTNDVSRDNFWNTTAIPKGEYVVMAFAEDTRGHADTAYATVVTTEADLTPPAQPIFKYTKERGNDLTLSWFPNADSDLLGYRLYFSFDNLRWSLFRDENVMTAAVNDTAITQVLNRDVYFRLTAVDKAPVPNESAASDVFGLSNGPFIDKVLIVDGFDRALGASWNEPGHPFVFVHGRAIIANGYSFDAATNDAVEDGAIDLNDYKAVFWILSDESSSDETFSQNEQALVKNYLENGGCLFVSGSEIAWDLDQDSGAYGTTTVDEQFLNQYLKANFVAKISNPGRLNGTPGGIFEGLNLTLSDSLYSEDSTHVVEPADEKVVTNLTYGDSRIAGLQFQGRFGSGATTAKLVYVAFPFEIISGKEARVEFMRRVLDFFFNVTSVVSTETSTPPREFSLLQNYPNPFNPETTVEFQLPQTARVNLSILNLLGQKVRTLSAGVMTAGVFRRSWNGVDDRGQSVTSGVYFLRFQAKSVNSSNEILFQKTHKMLILK
ncbi:MAG: FlgD immunoglobulin-like domain containing protein [bacterium]